MAQRCGQAPAPRLQQARQSLLEFGGPRRLTFELSDLLNALRLRSASEPGNDLSNALVEEESVRPFVRACKARTE